MLRIYMSVKECSNKSFSECSRLNKGSGARSSGAITSGGGWKRKSVAMSTSCRLSALLLLSLVASVPSHEAESGVPQVSYSQCIHHKSIDTRKLLILTFNQTELIQPATTTCAVNCLAANQSYKYTIIHIPARDQFRDQLVCGCTFSDYMLQSSSKYPDSWCESPCPSGRNPSLQPQPSPTKTLSQQPTCGNGRGLLSVYEIMYPSGSASSLINPLLLLAALFQCGLQLLVYLEF